MKRASKRNPREVTRRPLKLETLERREVFAVGGLDPTFAYGWGKTATDFGGSFEWAADSAFQADGKIVVVGGTEAGGGDDNFALARYNIDGSLDASFGGFGGIGAGRVATDFDGGRDQAQKVLIQADGKILVVGATNPFGIEYGESQYDPNQPVQENRWAIARYNADGSIDNSFGVLGKAVLHRPGVYDVLRVAGAFIVGDKLLLVSEGYNDALMTRVNLGDGSLDATYGNAGHAVATTPIIVFSAALHGDGIVLAGRVRDGSGMAFARIHLDGTVDTNFGNNGLAVIGPAYGGQLYAVVVQSDGAIVGAGEGVVVRVLSNGSPDATFSVDGVADWTSSPGYHEFRDLALGPNGTIVAAGYANTGKDFAVVRVKSTGAFDQNFGVDGMVKVDFGLFGFSNDEATSVLSYANGKILVSGVANGDFALARINGTPTLGNPWQRRPDGLLGQVPILPSTQSLFRPEVLLTLVQHIEQAIAQHRTDNPATQRIPTLRSSVPTSRTNNASRANQSSLLDDFFAELGDEASERGGSNSNIANHPHQLSLRASGSH